MCNFSKTVPKWTVFFCIFVRFLKKMYFLILKDVLFDFSIMHYVEPISEIKKIQDVRINFLKPGERIKLELEH
jgi:hypothetical protein